MATTETYAKIDLYIIKLADQAKNDEELMKFIKKVVRTVDSRGLTDDEINLIHEAYESEKDMGKMCDGILSVVDSHLIPNASSPESKVVYWKIKGDYYKHVAALTSTEAERKEAVSNASVAYQDAQDIASTELSAAHSLRLALTLSVSEFHHDIHKTPDRAINLAEAALDAAVSELGGTLDEDSKLMVGLLEEKINSWKSELATMAGDQTVDHSSYEE